MKNCSYYFLKEWTIGAIQVSRNPDLENYCHAPRPFRNQIRLLMKFTIGEGFLRLSLFSLSCLLRTWMIHCKVGRFFFFFREIDLARIVTRFWIREKSDTKKSIIFESGFDSILLQILPGNSSRFLFPGKLSRI